MSVLLQISEIVGTPLGNLVYHLVLLLSVEAALAMTLGEWRRAHREDTQRLLVATVGLVLLRVCYIAAAVVAIVGWVTPENLLPPLERFVDTASIILLVWAFMPPARRPAHSWDLVFGVNLVLAVAACVGFTVLWSQARLDDPALNYNLSWQATVWSAWQLGLVVLTILAVARERSEGWGTLFLAMIILVMGQVLQLMYPQAIAPPNLPVWERLANLIAYPLIAVAIYQRIVAALRVHSRQLQEISQASLDQIKSLLYLFDASQRMSSSLDLPTVLDNAVEGVARALDADQCAIAFPSEEDPGQMRLPAIYNPTRRGRGEAANFPLEYQLVIQQAMRRRGHVIIEGKDNVQLRALFALLGSSQSGPLLVQPLLLDGHAIGTIIVGNGHSRRPFTLSEAKLCKAMAEQIVSAIQNTRRYRKAQEKIAELTASEAMACQISEQAQAQVQGLGERLASTQAEIDTVRQARNALEIKLVSSRAETDTLSRRLALLEADLGRQQGRWLGVAQASSGVAPGLLVTDARGLIRAANEAAESLLGQWQAELEGRELQSLSDDDRWHQAVAVAARGEAGRLTVQFGAETLLCDVAPLPGGDVDPNRPQRIAVVLQPLADADGVEHTQLEAISTVVEELRIPTTTIIGYADLLLSEAMGGVGEVQRKFLLRIKASAERMARTVSNLSKEVGGNEQSSEPQSETVQVDVAIEGAVAASQVQIDEQSLTLDLELADNLPSVEVDSSDLQRILSCLVSNACLASPMGGCIEVQATPSAGSALYEGRLDQRHNGFVTISVRDSGEGLPEEALSQVFEQTRPSRIPQGLGESGAGLAQVKKLVEAQDGYLWVESEAGVGTTFSLVLPADQREEPAPVDQSVAAQDVARQRA
jgi:signal transduction histidine kinase